MCGEVQSPSDSLLSSVFPLLLQNTKEKNTAVKAAAEKAIVQLIHGDQHLQVANIDEVNERAVND